MSASNESYSTTYTMRTLEVLAASSTTSGRLAEQIGVHQRTARRILQRLAHDGYAEPDPNLAWGYRPSDRLRELAALLAAAAPNRRG